jgi:hypothetical protein
LPSGDRIGATGIDPTADYVAFARKAVPHPGARFLTGTAESLPFADGSFDAALRRPGDGARCPAGRGRGGLHLGLPRRLAHAPTAVAGGRGRGRRGRPRHRDVNPSRQHYAPADLQALWRDGWLSGIETQALELSMPFASFDDYWRPFLGGATRTSRFAAAADAETGGALARALAASITGVAPDGSFELAARAWAVKGTVQKG